MKHVTSLRAAFMSCASAAAIFVASSPVSAAETTLTAVTGLQKNNWVARSFLETFIPNVHKTCKGMVKIKYLGAQEIVPPRKAANALKRGQFDMLSAPIAYYIGTVRLGGRGQ